MVTILQAPYRWYDLILDVQNPNETPTNVSVSFFALHGTNGWVPVGEGAIRPLLGKVTAPVTATFHPNGVSGQSSLEANVFEDNVEPRRVSGFVFA